MEESFEEFKQRHINEIENIRNNMNKVITELQGCKNEAEMTKVMLRNMKYF